MPTESATTAGGARTASEDELLGAGDRVAQLLDDLRTMVGPPAWQRIEELVERLLELYGAGLERVVRHGAAVERQGGALAARLRGDELVSSLLALHGLHPATTGERVARAVEEVGERLGLGGVELVAVGEDGVVRLRVSAGARSCPSSAATVVRALERMILGAAPEVTRVEVDGLDAPPERREALVQLRPQRDGVVR